MQQQTQTSPIKVTLLLSGGHEYVLSLNTDDPLLETLFKILLARSQKQEKELAALLQIMIDGENAGLCVPAEHLIGVVTEPPIFIKNFQNVPEPASLPSSSDVLEAKYLQIDNFFSFQEYKEILAYTLDKQPEFVPTTTSTNAENYRKSLVLYEFGSFANLITEKVASVLPEVCKQLNIPLFKITQIEKQLTAHNDGNFYKVHNDNGSPNTASRQLTYVYYFYREPKPFTGGELIIYDSKIVNNYYVKGDTFQKIDPRNNSIVFFLSRYHHEVLPVNCPTQNFADSRFTVNGWIRN